LDYIFGGIKEACIVIGSLDNEFISIVLVSLRVAGTSTLLAALVGVPLGIFIAVKKFRGRRLVITMFHTLMSMPTVVVGLLVYTFICRRGPLGDLGLLYSLTAMIIGQFILALPIITSLAISAVSGVDKRIHQTLITLGADHRQRFRMFLIETRYGIIAAIVAGFGRVFAEIGVSMMLGGNIKGYTRNITTAIALETSKGEFALACALGIVLLAVAFVINGLLIFVQGKAK